MEEQVIRATIIASKPIATLFRKKAYTWETSIFDTSDYLNKRFIQISIIFKHKLLYGELRLQDSNFAGRINFYLIYKYKKHVALLRNKK